MTEISHTTAATLPALSWMKIINPSTHLGQVRYALFDFDGTISVIRRGWENVMIPMMVDEICGEHPLTSEIQRKVEAYVDKSTGILTIKQMQWLVQTVRENALNKKVQTAYEYKKQYNERLLHPVRKRLQALDGSQVAQDGLMIQGTRLFLQELKSRGVQLYLVSGTDHPYVMEEVHVLGINSFFKPHIYGAMDSKPDFTKGHIIGSIIRDNNLHGSEFVVFGDGPVEIYHAKANGAIAMGVAAVEATRNEFDIRKVQRLRHAGADLIISEFTHYQELANYLCSQIS